LRPSTLCRPPQNPSLAGHFVTYARSRRGPGVPPAPVDPMLDCRYAHARLAVEFATNRPAGPITPTGPFGRRGRVASLSRVRVALLALARRTSDIVSKQSVGIRRFLSESPRAGHRSRPVRTGKALLDLGSVGRFVREYLVPTVVTVCLGCMAIADGLALPWSATIAVLVGLGVHMAMQIRHP
jgi:hypothetical protein